MQSLIRVEFGFPVDDEDIYPYIRVEDPENNIEHLILPNEIVIPMQEIRIEYDYPLTRSVIKFFKSDDEAGFTRIELIRKICAGYQEIYDVEEDPGYIPGMFNRATSEGLYGIWGHYISDLILDSVNQVEGNLFGLSVSS